MPSEKAPGDRNLSILSPGLKPSVNIRHGSLHMILWMIQNTSCVFCIIGVRNYNLPISEKLTFATLARVLNSVGAVISSQLRTVALDLL